MCPIDSSKPFISKIYFVSILVSLNILNLLDLITTLYLYFRDLLVELNPIMNYVLQKGINFFIIYKIISVLGLSIFLYFFRNYRLTVYGSVIVCIIYLTIVLRNLYIVYLAALIC